MTTLERIRPTTASRGRGSAAQVTAALVEAAARGDVQVRRESRWPVYLINGQERPDARPTIAALIDQGLLVVVDEQAEQSEVHPTPAALAKIGVTR